MAGQVCGSLDIHMRIMPTIWMSAN